MLTDPERRQQYDSGTFTGVDSNKHQEPRTYQSASDKFTKSYHNNRVQLSGASMRELTVNDGNYHNQTCKITLQFEKNSLTPVLDRFDELVTELNKKTFKLDNNNLVVINQKYETVTDKMTQLYYEIMANINTLSGDLIDYTDMLRALKQSKNSIKEAQIDGEFSAHRGFARNCPILRELCVCLDLIVNSLDFLIKKSSKIASGDKTPVFSTMQDFKYGMFKPAPTNTARKVDKLNTDITLYINAIDEEYTALLGYNRP